MIYVNFPKQAQGIDFNIVVATNSKNVLLAEQTFAELSSLLNIYLNGAGAAQTATNSTVYQSSPEPGSRVCPAVDSGSITPSSGTHSESSPRLLSRRSW
mmetsp:Transcript_6293/g.9681  ORF Transcript_6293/g.9681 Transcript_6293/m.9681 type:complete len:99 (-) Transcript_6293:1522-1818(-)